MLDTTYDLAMIRVPERLDGSVSFHLASNIRQKIQEGSSIILDLENTRSIELECAEVILQGLQLAKQQHAYFSLRNVHPSVQTVLETTGILNYFRKI